MYGLLPRKRVKLKIKFYVLGVHVWQVPMKYAITSLFVFIRLTTQIRKASVIHLALNKCTWNQRTKKDVIPKGIADLFVMKRLAFSENKNVDKIPHDEARTKGLSTFDPRIESHRQINSDVSNFFHKVQIINENAVLFKSIETCDTTVCSDSSSLIVQDIKEKVLLQNTKTEQEIMQIFL